MHLEGRAFVNLLNPLLQSAPEAFRGKVLHAVAGIGNPMRFFTHLTALELSFTAHPFTDHHRFSAADLDFPDADAVLMTEKDAVKCVAIARENFWYLPVEAKVDSALADLILDRLKTHHGR
jgi:tetraacyldisaccharide 4'-kinase